ncbi:MAG: hypothetical protein NTY46_13315 [Candidatus Sumerlaeota bacterium]|nr:hypothetical protein [Candidatus Sumerlaeota bacterium]
MTTCIIAVAQIIGALLFILIPAVFVLMIVRMFLRRRDQQRLSRDEVAQLRNLCEVLQRMEDRIANLETILMHRDKTGGS